MKSCNLCFLAVTVRDKETFRQRHVKVSLFASLRYMCVRLMIDTDDIRILPLPFMGLLIEWGDGPCYT